MSFRAPLLRVLRTTAVLNIVNAASRTHPRFVMWHRFSAKTTPRAAGVELFDQQMRLLREHFDVVRFSDACAAIDEKRVRPNTVAVTIDDGYEDFLHYALPVLRKYQVPATLYTTSGFIDQRIWMWPDRLRYAIEHTRKKACECDLAGNRRVFDVSSPANRERAWNDLADHMLTLESHAAGEFLRSVVAELKVNVPDVPTTEFRALNWAQLREVVDAGIEIGGHTSTHPPLTKCTPEQVEREVTESKAELENQLQVPVVSFAYPHGVSNAAVRSAVRKAGYLNAASAAGADYRVHDVFDVKRIGGDEMVSFKNAVYGVHFAAARCGLQI
jgi:peptidoglycan/xylan/chitin deacetylase (PgdA/CDA1 family)